jgi:hypothetical protein
MAAMKTLRTLLAVTGFVLFTGSAVIAQTAPAPGTITARITHVEVTHGYLVAEWGAGVRSAIMMDKRALGTYRVGDTILLDNALRPLGRS